MEREFAADYDGVGGYWNLSLLTARCIAILHLLPTFRGPHITVGS